MSELVGVTASVAQQIVPFGAELAQPSRRGSAVGTVTSGILCGILFGRALGGYIGEHFGWRVTFWCGAALSMATASVLAATLPHRPPKTNDSYAMLLRSLGTLFAQEPALLRATTIQATIPSHAETLRVIEGTSRRPGRGCDGSAEPRPRRRAGY